MCVKQSLKRKLLTSDLSNRTKFQVGLATALAEPFKPRSSVKHSHRRCGVCKTCLNPKLKRRCLNTPPRPCKQSSKTSSSSHATSTSNAKGAGRSVHAGAFEGGVELCGTDGCILKRRHAGLCACPSPAPRGHRVQAPAEGVGPERADNLECMPLSFSSASAATGCSYAESGVKHRRKHSNRCGVCKTCLNPKLKQRCLNTPPRPCKHSSKTSSSSHAADNLEYLVPTTLDEKMAVQKQLWASAMPYFAPFDPQNKLTALTQSAEQQMMTLSRSSQPNSSHSNQGQTHATHIDEMMELMARANNAALLLRSERNAKLQSQSALGLPALPACFVSLTPCPSLSVHDQTKPSRGFLRNGVEDDLMLNIRSLQQELTGVLATNKRRKMAIEARAESELRVEAARLCHQEAVRVLEHKYLETVICETSKVEDCDNNDRCEMCGNGGDLLCCEGCPAALHVHCAKLREVPEGDFFCGACVLQQERQAKIQKEIKPAAIESNATAAGPQRRKRSKPSGAETVAQPVSAVSRLSCSKCRAGPGKCRHPGKHGHMEKEGLSCQSSAEVFQVECLVDHRDGPNGTEFLVKWQSWSSKYNSWEPKSNILDLNLVVEYTEHKLNDL